MLRRTIALVVLGAAAACVGTRESGETGPADLRACREMYASINRALSLVNESIDMKDREDRDRVLTQARAALLQAREGMGRYLFSLDSSAAKPVGRTVGAWVCPIHNRLVRDRPGNCPICDSRLRPADKVQTQPAPAQVSLADEMDE